MLMLQAEWTALQTDKLHYSKTLWGNLFPHTVPKSLPTLPEKPKWNMHNLHTGHCVKSDTPEMYPYWTAVIIGPETKLSVSRQLQSWTQKPEWPAASAMHCWHVPPRERFIYQLQAVQVVDTCSRSTRDWLLCLNRGHLFLGTRLARAGGWSLARGSGRFCPRSCYCTGNLCIDAPGDGWPLLGGAMHLPPPRPPPLPASHRNDAVEWRLPFKAEDNSQGHPTWGQTVPSRQWGRAIHDWEATESKFWGNVCLQNAIIYDCLKEFIYLESSVGL